MATAGPNTPGTIAEQSLGIPPGTGPWADLANAASDNGVYASSTTISETGNQETTYLKCTGFGFAIPAGSTINGFQVTTQAKKTNVVGTTAGISSQKRRMVKGGTVQSTDLTNAGSQITTSEASYTHGSASDLGGASWTAADVNASDFGVALSWRVQTLGSDTARVDIDVVTITVHYTPPAGFSFGAVLG